MPPQGIAESLYYSWSKEFLEAGKKRLAGDTARDKPLSPNWKLKNPACFAPLNLSPAPSGKHALVRDNVLLNALMEARGQGRNISYGRRAKFYADKRRYFPEHFTKERATWAVDSLAPDLLFSDKARPGTRGCPGAGWAD